MLIALMLNSCSHDSSSHPAGDPRQVGATLASDSLLPARDLMDDRCRIEFAIYYLPQPTQDPLNALDRLVKERFPNLNRVETIDAISEGRVVAARLNTSPKNDYAPPDVELLHHFGRGISREQAQTLQNTESAVILDFAHSKEQVWEGLRSACELTESLARSTGGLIWDETTGEVFGPDEWENRRVKDWAERVPDMSMYTVIHAYKKDEYVRAITLGMQKFGLPDLVVEDFSWSLSHDMSNMIIMVAQAIAEGARPQPSGEFDLNLRSIQHPKLREAQLAGLRPNASGAARLLFKKGTWEEGDPQNRLIEIGFDLGTGPDVHAKEQQIVGQIFGAEDQAARVEHSAEVKAASQKARAKLPALRAEFVAGLGPGEYLQVKAPFDCPDGGREWMWVEVTSWKDGKITGLLKNEPLSIPTLHAGQVVVVSEADVFDYLRNHANGSREGNETAKVIAKQSG